METSLKSVSYTSSRLGVSPFTVRRLVDLGAVRAVHVGARLLIPTEEIERVIAHGAGKPRARWGKVRKPATHRHRSAAEPTRTALEGKPGVPQ